MTPLQLQAALGCPITRSEKWAAPITAAMSAYGIETITQKAAFIAQVGHESGRLAYVRELWGPTPSQERYEGRTDLGNTEPGDGFRFRGRGLIQITGRFNYKLCSDALGYDFVSDPAQLETPVYASLSAAWFWNKNKLNQFVDSGNFEKLTRRINGGLNGIQDRRNLWAQAKIALGICTQPT